MSSRKTSSKKETVSNDFEVSGLTQLTSLQLQKRTLLPLSHLRCHAQLFAKLFFTPLVCSRCYTLHRLHIQTDCYTSIPRTRTHTSHTVLVVLPLVRIQHHCGSRYTHSVRHTSLHDHPRTCQVGTHTLRNTPWSEIKLQHVYARNNSTVSFAQLLNTLLSARVVWSSIRGPVKSDTLSPPLKGFFAAVLARH